MQNTGLLLCPRSYIKDCPFQSSTSSDWLAYLDRLERDIRSGRIVDTENYLIAVYEAAVQAVPEDWSDQNYTIMIMRLAILKGNSSCGENADLLISLRICGRTNAPLMIALAHYYALLGQTKRAEDALVKAKANVVSEEAVQLVERAMELLKSKHSLRPLTGVYDYIPFAKGTLYQESIMVISPRRRSKSVSPKKEKLKLASLTSAPQVLSLEASNAVSSADLSESSVSSIDMSCSSMEITQCQPSNPPTPSVPAVVHPSTAFLPPSRLSEKPQPPEISLGHRRAISKIVEIEETEDEEDEDEYQGGTLLVEPRRQQRSRHRSSSSTDRTLAVQPRHLSDVRLLWQPAASALHCPLPPPPLPEEDKENLPIRQYQPQRQPPPPRPPPPPFAVLQPETAIVGGMISKKDLTVVSDLFESAGVSISGEKYLVLREIGRGGFSTVYCVLNRERKLCALKQVQFAATQGVLDVCQNEVNLLLSLRDTGRVISIFSHQITTTHLDLVMELAEQNLKLFLQERMPSAGGDGLSNIFIVFYWTEMLACVKVLHDRRIVHLDLKPENFVLVQGRLKLIDLGISQRLPMDSTHMDLERPMGSMAYMSPEQMLCISGSTRSPSGGLNPLTDDDNECKVRLKADIWALGIILFEMTFGRTPFHGMNPASIIASLLNPSFRVQIPHIQNTSLVKALRWCLVRDTRARATVDDLLRMNYCACPNSNSVS